MRYNNRIRMQDLFMNPSLAGVFPQFSKGEFQKSDFSFSEIKMRVAKYLANALSGAITGDGEIVVCGKFQTVLQRVRGLTELIESFFNNMPTVSSALKRNASLYLPYATSNQLARLRTTESKTKAMRAVMENFQYNTDLGALNSVLQENAEEFARHKREWEERVGYRRLKKV